VRDVITNINPGLQITDPSKPSPAGIITRPFHTWLQSIQRALRGPFVGRMATGTKVIADGEYGLHAEELILNGAEEITIEGDGVLVAV
jgi:hypothetical protein